MQNRNWSKFLRFWFPVIIYSGIIFYASSVPNLKTPLQEIQFDKILHFLAYIPFGFLVARGIGNTRASASPTALINAALIASFFFGLSDEIHQIYVPGRTVGLIDIIADTIGGVCGGYVYTLVLQYLKNK